MIRRDFLAAAAGLGVGRFSLSPLPTPLSPIGVQLYTVRNELERDFEGTLTRIAQIGYREVEFWNYYHRTPQQVRAVLDRLGLRAPSAHIDPALLAGDWGKTLADARIMGHRYLVVAWMPEQMRRTIADWRRVGALFNDAGRAAQRMGITFAYHNHDFEFVPLGGEVPFDVLLEATNPRFVKIEMDLFWIRKGGKDPLDYFRRWPGRFPMVHVKDMAEGGAMVDVGAGAIDWRAIFRHRRRAGISHYFIEHDEPADAMQSITNSFNYLSRLDV